MQQENTEKHLDFRRFLIKEIAFVESPYFRRLNKWPQSGFSLAAVHLTYIGKDIPTEYSIKMSTITGFFIGYSTFVSPAFIGFLYYIVALLSI